jgi:hypothetical protein
MKITLSTHQIAGELMRDENAKWSRSGAYALAEWLEEIEEDCGIELELDTVALRCEYAEYESVAEAAGAYGWEPDEYEFYEQHNAAAQQFLEANTDIRIFNGGVIICQF